MRPRQTADRPHRRSANNRTIARLKGPGCAQENVRPHDYFSGRQRFRGARRCKVWEESKAAAQVDQRAEMPSASRMLPGIDCRFESRPRPRPRQTRGGNGAKQRRGCEVTAISGVYNKQHARGSRWFDAFKVLRLCVAASLFKSRRILKKKKKGKNSAFLHNKGSQSRRLAQNLRSINDAGFGFWMI